MSYFLKKLRLYLDCKIVFKEKGNTVFRRLFTRHKDKMLHVQIPGLQHEIYLRPHTTDVEVFRQVFMLEQYRFSNKINDKGIRYIIDCGANIGLSALHFHLKYPEATIVAVELEKGNFELMKKNLDGYSNIKSVHAGIWSENTLLEIPDMNASEWMFTAEKSTATDVAESPKANLVQGITIPWVMEQYNIPVIDLLKIDIEGAEFELFGEGADEFLSKTRLLVIELHDYIKEGVSKKFFAAIDKYNYRLFISGENMVCEFQH